MKLSEKNDETTKNLLRTHLAQENRENEPNETSKLKRMNFDFDWGCQLTKKSPSTCQLFNFVGSSTVILLPSIISLVPRLTIRLSFHVAAVVSIRSSPPKRSQIAPQAWANHSEGDKWIGTLKIPWGQMWR